MRIVDVRNQLARHPTKEYSRRPIEAIKYIVIHHSATTEGDAFKFARYHVNNKDWPGISYHYVILKDGTIQWTNDLNICSYHVKSYNQTSLGICLVGKFTEEELQSHQKEAVRELCQKLLAELGLSIADIKGHDELGLTLCPALDMDDLREYIADGNVEIFLNNEKLNTSTILKNGTTFVAIRPLAEALGCKVTWEGQTRRVYLEKSNELEQIKHERDYYLSIIKQIKSITGGV